MRDMTIKIIRGSLIFIIAFFISLIYSNFMLDSNIDKIKAEEDKIMYKSREFSVEDRIEYAFKNLLIAEDTYKEALDHGDWRREALLRQSERFCQKAICLYPDEHYSYILLKRIYGNMGDTEKYNEIVKKLKEIEDNYYTK